MRWRAAMALLLSLCLPSALAQQGPYPAPRPPRAGFGIELDLGQLLWGAARLLKKDEETYAPGELVLAWDAALAFDPEAWARRFDGRVKTETTLAGLGLSVAVLALPEERLEEARTLLAAEPGVTVDRHAVATPLGDGAPVHARAYAFALIGAPGTARLARPVRIGLIDGAFLPNLGLAAQVQSQSFTNAPDDGVHASSVACLIACTQERAGGFVGLLDGVQLFHAAVLDASTGRPRSDTFTVVRALDWLLTNDAEIVHVSLGSRGDAVLARAIATALPKMRALVAAAGNGGKTPVYPAAYPGVISVAAVDADARPWREGSRGAYVTIAAPGVDVWVPVGGGRYMTGSSFAAPFVTAVLAFDIARGREANGEALCRTAHDLPPAGRDDATGCGLMQWPKEKD